MGMKVCGDRIQRSVEPLGQKQETIGNLDRRSYRRSL